MRHALTTLLVGFFLAGVPARAAELVIGVSQYPTTLHPSTDSHLVTLYTHGLLRRPLTTFDADWQPQCLICTKLPSRENGLIRDITHADGSAGLAVTYTIAEDLFWADGVPVTAADIAFSHEVGRHPDTGFSNATLYRRDILGIEVEGDHRFTVIFDKPQCRAEMLNDFAILPEHVERPIFEADPALYRRRTAFDTDPTNPGLAFGPYHLSRVEPGASLTVARNPYWRGQQPDFDTITLRVIENTAAMENNLLAGSIDMLPAIVGLSLDQAIGFERRHGERFAITARPGLAYEHIDLNLDHPALADRRVRQALLLALDREAISDSLFEGRQPVALSNVHPLDAFFSEEVTRWPHDPARAQALLEEAGWTPGPGGVRVNAAGERLSLSFSTTAGDRIRELVQQVLQGMWKAVGVEVEIRNQPARVLFGQTLNRREFDGMVQFAWIAAPDNVPRTTLHSSNIPSPANGWTGQNYTGFNDARADQLIDALEVTCEAEPRRALWAELQQLYTEELPALPLFFRVDPLIAPIWLEGVRPTGHREPATYWVEHWRDTR